jgi:hypothetical protein
MGIRFGACANALRTGAAVIVPSAAIPEMICRRLGRNNMFGNPSLSVIASNFAHICHCQQVSAT